MAHTSINGSSQRLELTDGKSLTAEILPYGAIIKNIQFNNKEVTFIVDNPDYYFENPYYLGATIGRFANRIANGRFSLAGTHYQLGTNNESNSLHGGIQGFDKVLWQVTKVSSNEVELYYRSPDGDQGFLGCLQVWQTISANNGELSLCFKLKPIKKPSLT